MEELKSANIKEEVTFGELELRIAKPELKADKTMEVSGNFIELGNKIRTLVEQYKDTKLTEDNVAFVKTLKGQFVSLRTGIDRERKEWKKVYLTPAEKLIDTMCKELQEIVAEGENALGKQLEEYDQRRKDELTAVLTEYVRESAEKHNLREEYASQIVLKDKYYNKTQDEEDSIDDIELQAAELEKKQKEYDAGVALIKEELEGTDMLPDTYLRELQYKSATVIILEIKEDKKLAAEIKAKADSGEKITVGEPVKEEVKATVEVKAEENVEYRTRTLKVTYRADQAKLMQKFFTENGIKFSFI